MVRMRGQVIIALIAILLLAAAMGYLGFTMTTVTVADYGGTYVEGIAGNPRVINPILCQPNSVDSDLVALTFDGLTSVNERGESEPALAERWDISPDGTSYTFYLRQDVLWHDGAPFTAEDVVYTVGAIQHPAYQGLPFLADMWRAVTVQMLDTYTVRFSLRRDGSLFGEPRVTWQTQNTESDLRRRFTDSVVAAVRSCTPMRLSPQLGAAIAGRPLSIRFHGRAPSNERPI